MPQFHLNDDNATRRFRDLSDFAKGFVEAMFFTNEGMSDDDGDDKLNRLGVERLTVESIAKIAADCAAFWKANEADLEAAKALVPGNDDFFYAREPLDDRRLGHLFLYTRQGHGVGFDDDGNAPCLTRLDDAATIFPECHVSTYRGWIYVQ